MKYLKCLIIGLFFTLTNTLFSQEINLSQEETFIKIYTLEKEIISLFYDTSRLERFSDQETEEQINLIKNTSSFDELNSVLASIEIQNHSIITEKIIEKHELYKKLFEKYPQLLELPSDQSNAIFAVSWKTLKEQESEANVESGSCNACCRAYHTAVGDCAEDMALQHYMLVYATIGTSIFGTPAAGLFTYSTGAFGIYLEYKKCMSRAVRAYNSCH